MRQGLETAEDPGYLQYWEVRAENSPEDERVARIVNGLTHVALRGEAGSAEYTDREPALQARYWYRTLGPLNPMGGVEADLITAVEKMYGQRTERPEESANLKLDTVYALTDLARVTDRPQTQTKALGLALEEIRSIKADERHADREAGYRIQAAILEGDIKQDATRLLHTNQLEPVSLAGQNEEYRRFEKAFAVNELQAISEFGKMIEAGITDENFGILFEWYFILARRHQAWADEEIDTISVRGATSRENAEWTGEDDPVSTRVSGNHDVVITTRAKNGSLGTKRLQLKAVKGERRYHPSIQVIDFQEAFDTRFRNIDQATSQLVKNLVKFRNEYRSLL